VHRGVCVLSFSRGGVLAGFGAWVGVVVGVAHPLGGQVGVDLRGAQRLVPQELLHGAEVGPVLEQVGRERVAQRVRADRRIEPDLTEIFIEFATDRTRGDAPAVLVEEEHVLVWGVLPRGGKLGILIDLEDVLVDCFECVGAQRDESFFASLATHEECLVVLVEILHVQIDELGDPYTRGEERLEHGAVATAQHVVLRGCREELLDLVERDNLGEALGLLGRADEDHGVCLGVLVLVGPLVEGSEGRDLACHGGGGVLLIVEVGEETPDGVGIGLADKGGDGAWRRGLVALEQVEGLLLNGLIDDGAQLVGEVLDKLAQIGAVALGGVRAEVSLVGQVRLESMDDRESGHG
jgi:hypothetical protein